ncbi:MAG: zinc-dependent metalloprotease [Actinomycetota bacterium]
MKPRPTPWMIAAYNRAVTVDPSWTPGDLPPDLLGRIPLFAELQKVLSWTGGPVNWDLARQIAVATAAAQEGTHQINPAAEAELSDDARIAEMWIAEAFDSSVPPLSSPSSLPSIKAVTPSQWAEHACGAYRELIDPIAQKVAASIAQQGPEAIESGMLPPGMDSSVLTQAMSQMGPLLLGVQAGGVIGAVAKNLLGEHDLPIPTDNTGQIRVLLSNVDAFASRYALDPKEVRLWVTLHQTAHRMIFEAFPGTSTQFWALYLDYVSSLNVDFNRFLERIQGLDLTNPAALESGAAVEGLFAMLEDSDSAQSPAALEIALALIEALADYVVLNAAAGRLPSATQIGEAALRNMSDGGAGAAMRSFIGIASPDDVRRLASQFTGFVAGTAGWDRLIALWDESASLPTRLELAEPETWIRRTSK